jgi:hypothetical protein
MQDAHHTTRLPHRGPGTSRYLAPADSGQRSDGAPGNLLARLQAALQAERAEAANSAREHAGSNAAGAAPPDPLRLRSRRAPG